MPSTLFERMSRLARARPCRSCGLAIEPRRIEAGLATCDDCSADGCPVLTEDPAVKCDGCDCWKGMR